MNEQEPEEYAKQKYSRDDEDEVGWRFDALSEGIPRQHSPFFPLSEFSVYKKAARTKPSLSFPPYIQLTNNYFRKTWAFPNITYRRIKNVIVTMEWLDAGHLDWIDDNSVQSLEGLSREQEERLRRTFSIFSEAGREELDYAGMQQMLLAADVRAQDMSEPLLEDLLRRAAPEGTEDSIYGSYGRYGCSYDQLKEMMRLKTFYRYRHSLYCPPQLCISCLIIELVAGYNRGATSSRYRSARRRLCAACCTQRKARRSLRTRAQPWRCGRARNFLTAQVRPAQQHPHLHLSRRWRLFRQL